MQERKALGIFRFVNPIIVNQLRRTDGNDILRAQGIGVSSNPVRSSEVNGGVYAFLC